MTHSLWRQFLAAAGFLALCSPTGTAVASEESPSTIRAAVLAYVLAQLPDRGQDSHISVDVPAASVRFPHCAHLQVQSFGYGNPYSNQTVQVLCSAPQAWSLYVPVRVIHGREILITTRPLSAGTVITAGDIREMTADSSSLAGTPLISPRQAIGQTLRLGTAAGQPLLADMLAAPDLVHAGTHVTLVAEGGGVRVATIGEALESGHSGQTVLVRNLQTGRVITGIVGSNGEVLAPF